MSAIASSPRTEVTGRRRSTAGPWGGYLGRRVGRLVVSMLAIVTASFALVALVPGDPARNSLGPTASPQAVAERRHVLGLDQPLVPHFRDYLVGLLHGDLGISTSLNMPVGAIIGQRWAVSVNLALLAFLIAVVTAVPVGVAVAAATQGGRRRALDLAFTVMTGLLFSVPGFLLAVGLAYAFAVKLGWFPIAGVESPAGYALPVAALAVGPAAAMARLVRLEVLRVLDLDLVRTARAKRMPATRLYLRHALPNTLTALLSFGGLLLGGLLASTVLVETIFAVPGLGSLLTSSILHKDYNLVQAQVILFGGAVLVINLLVDVLMAIVDPRTSIRER
ncbi:ABC transporter permease [Dactylosporangium sp. CA-233914]|uniref:ABC transporter permease n=1 Tax=Dactylosporangium sp. CA-233914 TaxID=3239934 RepID=UPI003D8F810B